MPEPSPPVDTAESLNAVVDSPGAPLVIAVVGPTASGKSALALDLAERLAGEVVNADAMQLYRGMDIGTAKLTLAERRGVPHHQLDVLGVRDESSVATYQRNSRCDIEGILSRGRVPIVVGGSGLYVRAALDRLEIPPTDPDVRARFERQLDAEGVAALFARLSELDPAAAGAMQPGNGRRIVRALEAIELTGRPWSATMPRREYLRPTITIGLVVPRPELDERITARVHRMWDAGLLEEVRCLDRAGLREGRTSSRALGYSQALGELDGRLTNDQAIQETISASRRLARRQESWFRPDPRIRWLTHADRDLLGRALSAIADPGPIPHGVREDGPDD